MGNEPHMGFKFPETTINKELKLICQWLDANKLTLNVKKKSNYVIFRPCLKN